MNIGYACLNMDILNCSFRTCRICNVTTDRLIKLIDINIELLEKIIDYNIKYDIHLFRISSDIIPFGSNDCNTIEWDSMFKHRFIRIGDKIKNNNIRVSMHPGQYTVINSPNEGVVERSINDLIYHSCVLNALSCDKSNKIVLHIGGVYNDKDEAKRRFIRTYKELPTFVKERLVIENDDKNYTIQDVLSINKHTNCPVVFDNLHNKVNPSILKKNENEWIELSNKTWKKEDGRQKIHYSQQDVKKQAGAHSKTIDVSEFLEFAQSIKSKEIDIMLEVKDKNRSAIKCINHLRTSRVL